MEQAGLEVELIRAYVRNEVYDHRRDAEWHPEFDSFSIKGKTARFVVSPSGVVITAYELLRANWRDTVRARKQHIVELGLALA
jgi:hypothetical protein